MHLAHLLPLLEVKHSYSYCLNLCPGNLDHWTGKVTNCCVLPTQWTSSPGVSLLFNRSSIYQKMAWFLSGIFGC